MTNYDNTTPASQDDDLNLLVDMVMPAAVERFPPQGRLRPFGAAIGVGGDQLHITSDLDEETHPDEIIAHLDDIARANIDSLRAVAFVSVVRHGGGDGIRVAIDRQKGGAVSVVFPASRKRLTEKVDLGEPSVAAESGWLWTESDAAANPSAPDWRDETPQHVQDDFDALFAQLLPFAEQTLGRYGEMYPFGAAILRDGQCRLLAAETGADNPPSQELLDLLLDGARTDADAYRAVALVCDVLVNGTDAVQLEAEHRDGTAISTVMPYSRDSAAKTVSFAGGRTRLARTRVWTL